MSESPSSKPCILVVDDDASVLVSVGCALYPAWRATRISPTEALHYE